MQSFDAIVAGAGIWGCTVARRLAEAGKRVLVLEKRAAVGGNCRCEIDPETGIEVHTYGSHIFHTSNEEVWAFVNRFTKFNDYRHCVLAKTKKVGGESRWTKDGLNSDSDAIETIASTIDRRACAERKVAEWLSGVDETTFEVALVKLVDEKSAAGEYRFKKPIERELALEGARKFYREFSRKIVPLSDGRYVYFAPDERAKTRNASNVISWAEYAFHAVSSSGKLLDGKNFRERLYNRTKAADLPFLEGIIQNEQCMYRLIDAYPENDAVIFIGQDDDRGRLEVITRLDQFGNAEANLGEVTVIAKHKKKENPPPKFRPLTEVVEAVAKHQAAGFSPSTTERSIANCRDTGKGGGSYIDSLHTYHLPIGCTLLKEFFGREIKPSEMTDDERSQLFDAFIRGYTSKQWGVVPEKVDPSIIARLKVRDNYSTDYFDDPHQGIPADGYNKMFERMLDHPNITVQCNCSLCLDGDDVKVRGEGGQWINSLLSNQTFKHSNIQTIYYSGPIDALFNYKFGALPWRTLRFERETLSVADFQGNSVVNYTDADVPYTRIHEFKHYHPEWGGSSKTVIMREYSATWKQGDEPYYPINTPESAALLARYQSEVEKFNHRCPPPPNSSTSLTIGGRLGQYKYFDMDKSIAAALSLKI